MEEIKQSLKKIVSYYQLSDEFNHCLNDLLDQHEGGDLSKLHFQLNGGTLTKSIQEVVDGQHHDIINQITSEEMYVDVVKKKSGSLIALSCIWRSISDWKVYSKA